MEDELKAVVRHLAETRWPFRIHATYDETITRILNVYEEVDRDVPFDGLHWFSITVRRSRISILNA